MSPFTGGGKSSPMGYARFPEEINVPPRAWVERSASSNLLIHRTELPRWNRPTCLPDVSGFSRKVRASGY